MDKEKAEEEARLEKVRLEKEVAEAKKMAKKQKIEELKKQGLYLTPAQKK